MKTVPKVLFRRRRLVVPGLLIVMVLSFWAMAPITIPCEWANFLKDYGINIAEAAPQLFLDPCTPFGYFYSNGECCRCVIGNGAGSNGPMECCSLDFTTCGINEDHGGCLPRPTDVPPPAPTATSTPTNTPVPPTPTPVPPTNTPVPPPPQPTSPSGGRQNPTRTPRPVGLPTATLSLCQGGNIQGSCGLTRIQAAELLRQDLRNIEFPPNQLPPPSMP